MIHALTLLWRFLLFVQRLDIQSFMKVSVLLPDPNSASLDIEGESNVWSKVANKLSLLSGSA